MSIAPRPTLRSSRRTRRNRGFEVLKLRRRIPNLERLESRRLLDGSGDLATSITDYLDDHLSEQTINDRITLASTISLGSDLSMVDPTLTFDNVTHDSSSGATLWTGSITLSASSASLDVGPSGDFSMTVRDGLSGTYILDDQAAGQGAFSLTASAVTVNVSTVLTATADTVTFGYDPASTTSKLNLDITSATATIHPFGDASISLKDLNVTDSGFSVGNASVNVGDLTLGGFIKSTGTTLSLDDVSEQDGGPLEGSITLSAGSVSLFPGSSVSASVEGFSGTYTMGNSGPSLSASSVTVSVDSILTASATDLSFDASGSSITISAASTTLISPKLSGVSATLTDFTLDDSGFSISQADLTGSVKIGSLLEADGADLSVKDLSYQFASNAISASSIKLTADSVSLFPGQTAFTSSVENFSGTYDLDTGNLALSADSASITVGSIVKLSATGLDFEKEGSSYSITAGSTTLTSPKLSGVSAALANFKIDNAGFSVEKADLTGSVRIGNLLEVAGADLSVSDLSYLSATHALSASSISLSADSVALFPGQTTFTSSVTNFSGTYELDTGNLSLSADSASITVGSILKLDATGLTFEKDGSSYSLSVGTADLSSPRFPSLKGSLADFTLSNSGFSIASASLSADIKLGSLLKMDQAKLEVDDLDYTADTGALSAGSITLSADKIALFPGNSMFSTTVTDFQGAYDLKDDSMTLSAGEINVQVGSLMTLDAKSVSFGTDPLDPSSYEITLESAELDVPKLGVSTTLTDLDINSSGFTLGSADLKKDTLKLGSLAEIKGFDLNLTGLQYDNSSGAFTTQSVTASVSSATLFPSASSVFSASVTGLTISADLTTGDLSVSADSLDIKAKDLLKIHAEGLAFALTDGQYTISVDSATASMPRLAGLEGQITGLQIDESGVSIGSATLSMAGSTRLDGNGPISFTNPSVSISDLSFKDGSAGFDSDLHFTTQSASLNVGARAFKTTVTDVSGTIGLKPDDLGQFNLQAGTLSVGIGKFLTLTGHGIALNTAPTLDDPQFLQVDSLGAELALGGIQIGGSVSHFELDEVFDNGQPRTDSNGFDVLQFAADQDFSVSLNLDSLSSLGSFPSWLPLKIQDLSASWPDVNNDASNFTLDLSASVDAKVPGTNIALSGFIDHLTISPSLVEQGKFPVTGISGAGLSVSGSLFGFGISGGMFLDTFTDSSTGDHVLYGGIEAGISFEKLSGFQIRMALSEYGPLEVSIEAAAPIIIDPISGLTLDNFFASVDFNDTSLADIQDPDKDLSFSSNMISGLVNPGLPVPIETWKEKLASQVQQQADDAGHVVPSNPFAKLSAGNIVFKGGATLFSEYASEYAFRLSGGIAVDLAGHVLLAGSLTMGNTVSIDAAAYFNFADVANGDATLLMHAEAPGQDQDPSTPYVPPLVTAYGDLQVSYSNGVSLGSSVTFANAPSADDGGDYAESNDSIPIQGSSFSVGFWAQRPGQTTGQVQDIIGQAGKGEGGLHVGFDAGNKFFVSIDGQTVTAPDASDNAWHHWAVTYDKDSGSVAIYEDGANVINGTVEKGGMAGDAANFLIGKSDTSSFTGSVDEVRIWSVALSLAQIVQWKNKGDIGPNTGSTSDLLAEWTFDGHTPGDDKERDGTTISDAANRGHDAILHIGDSAPRWSRVVASPDQTDSTTSFTISLTGGIDIKLPKLKAVSLHVEGSAAFTYVSDTSGERLKLQISGKMDLNPIGNLVDLAGELDFVKPSSGDASLYGAFLVEPGNLFSKLENVGLTVDGYAYFEINTQSIDQGFTLKLPDKDPTKLTLPAESATIWVTGTVSFSRGDQTWFDLHGDLYMSLHAADPSDASSLEFQVYLDATLDIGPSDSPWLSAHAQGFLQINSEGIAAKIDASLDTGNIANLDLDASTSFLVELNTTDREITFTLPDQIDGYSVPDLNGADSRTVDIPDRPTLPDGSEPDAPEPYLLLQADATVNIVDVFKINGSFDLVVAPNILTLDFDASVSLHIPGEDEDLVSGHVTGGLTIDSQGLVAALDVSLNAGSSDSFSIDASGLLEINTTGQEAVIAPGSSNPITVPAGANGFYAKIAADGSITIDSNPIADASIDLTVTGESLVIYVHGSLDVPIVGNVTVDGTLGLVSGGGLYGDLSVTTKTDGSDPVHQALKKIGLDFSTEARFQVEINTTSSYQYVTGFTVNTDDGSVKDGQTIRLVPQSFGFDMGGQVTLFNDSFQIGGDLSFLISTSDIKLHIDGSIGILDQSVHFDKTFEVHVPKLSTLTGSDDSGFYVYDTLDLSADLTASDSGFGIKLGGDLVFGFNTTDNYTYTAPNGEKLCPGDAIVGIEHFTVSIGNFRTASCAGFDTSIVLRKSGDTYSFNFGFDVHAGFDGLSVVDFGGSIEVDITAGGSDNWGFGFTMTATASVNLPELDIVGSAGFSANGSVGYHDGTAYFRFGCTFIINGTPYTGSVDLEGYSQSAPVQIPVLDSLTVTNITDPVTNITDPSPDGHPVILYEEEPQFHIHVTDPNVGGGINLWYDWKIRDASGNVLAERFHEDQDYDPNGQDGIDIFEPTAPPATPYSLPYNFDTPGTYYLNVAVQARARDGDRHFIGEALNISRAFQVVPPSITVSAPSAPSFAPAGQPLTFSTTATFVDPSGPGEYYSWTVSRDGHQVDASPFVPSSFTYTPTVPGLYQVTVQGHMIDSHKSFPGYLSDPESTTSFRVYAANQTITVNSTGDASDFSSPDVTLSEALEIANAVHGTWTINFAPGLAGRTIDLRTDFGTSATTFGPTAFDISSNTRVVLDGSQAPGLTVERPSDADAMRLFFVGRGASLEIDHLTLRGGLARGGTEPDGETGAGFGGAIFNLGTLTLDGSTLTDNQAIGGDGGSNRSGVGGTFGYGASGFTVPDSVSGGFGGGSGTFYSSGGGAGMGGAVYNAGTAHLVIVASTLTDNLAQGGRPDFTYPVPIYGGTGSGLGGAIFNHNGSVTLVNDTIFGNSVHAGDSGSKPIATAGQADGSGIYSYQDGVWTASVSVTNTILDGSGGHSSLVNNGGSLTQSHNLVDTDPRLAPLGLYGGPTPTMPLFYGSPAIDAGTPSVSRSTDQRGMSYQGAPDIGAYESAPDAVIVTSTGDSDGFSSPGVMSLRTAIDTATSLHHLDPKHVYQVRFSPSLAGRTIYLSSVGDTTEGASAIGLDNTQLVIDGSDAPMLTIARASGAPAMRLFFFGNHAQVEIDNLTLSGGLALGRTDTTTGAGLGGFGGAIYNRGDLTLRGDTLSGNTAHGGAGGTGSGTSSTFGSGAGGSGRGITSGNFGGGASYYLGGGGGAGLGGAIFNDGSHARIELDNSTLASNTARGGAAGTYLGTLAGASGSGYGAAIFNYAGNATLQDTTIAGNTASAGPVPAGLDYSLGAGQAAGAVYGLIGNIESYNSIIAGTRDGSGDPVNDLVRDRGTFGGNANLIGKYDTTDPGIGPVTIAISADPQLGPLRDNGGPTPTMMPASDSPVRGIGQPREATDQRGAPRNGPDGSLDIGAVNSPTPLVVTSDLGGTQPPGEGLTLREALLKAKNFSAHDGRTYTILFASTLAHDTISLSSIADHTFGPSAFAIPTGAHIILDASQAPGLTLSRLSDAPMMRLFYVAPGASLELDGLTLSGGYIQGGVTNGAGDGGLGGAVLNQGKLTLVSSTLSRNTARGGDGGYGIGDGKPGGFGDGAAGDSLFLHNSPGFGGGASNVESGGGGAGLGGAIFNDEGAVLTVKDTTLTANTARGGAPGSLNGVLYAGAGSGYGGAIFNHNGTVVLINDTLYANGVLAGSYASGTEEAPGSADASGVYSLQDGSGQAVLRLSNSIMGESASGAHNLVVNGGIVNGTGNQVASSSGVLPSVAAPTGVSLSSPDTSTTVGDAFNLSGQFDLQSDSDTISVQVDWGDGTSSQLSLQPGDFHFGPLSHTFKEISWGQPGHAYTVTVTVQSASGETVSASIPVLVNALPVSLTAGATFLDGLGQTSGIQEIASFTDPAGLSLHPNTPYEATVSWGDGTSTQATFANGGLVLSDDGQALEIWLAHQYQDAIAGRTYSISVEVDHEGGVATLSGPSALIVSLSPPTNISIERNTSQDGVTALVNQHTIHLSGYVPTTAREVLIWGEATDKLLSTETLSPGTDGTLRPFSAGFSLGEGIHVLRIEALDPLSGAISSTLYQVTVDTTPPRLAAASLDTPTDTQAAVETIDLTFDSPLLQSTLNAGGFTLTHDGQPISLSSTALLISALSPTHYQLSGLSSLNTAEGRYTLTITPEFGQDSAGNSVAGGTSVSWVVDRTAPDSHILPVPTTATTDHLLLTIDGSDPGASPSGVASLAIDVSIDGAPFQFWKSVPDTAGQTTVTYPAQDGHHYAFRSVATDASGNVESKALYAEAGTYVPDLTAPVTHIDSASKDDASAQFLLNVSGSDVGGSLLSQFAIYVQVDGGPAQLVAKLPAGSADSGGVYHASAVYQALQDGLLHFYHFFSRGIDGAGNSEPVATIRQGILTSASFSAQPLAVTGLVVQGGTAERSLIQTVDVEFNHQNGGTPPPLTTLIAENRIKLIHYSLDGTQVLGTVTPSDDINLFKVVDHAIELDFGAYGLGGVARGSMTLGQYWSKLAEGDGYYDIAIDLAGDGSFSTHEHFYRMLGDINGDRIVNRDDLDAVALALAQPGTNPGADVNGDGVVNGFDRYLTTRSQGRSLAKGLEIDD